MSQHSGLRAERWRQFPIDQQLLMIANEMNRASKLLGAAEHSLLRNAYERTLRLADLTIEVNDRPALRRELLRWRDLVAHLYVSAHSEPGAHGAALRSLLQLSPITYAQLEHLVIPGSA